MIYRAMVVLALLLGLAAVVCCGNSRRELGNFPLKDCSTDKIDFLFLYHDGKGDDERSDQEALAQQLASNVKSFSRTRQLQFAAVLDTFSSNNPNVSVSSWTFQTTLEPTQNQSKMRRAQRQYYSTERIYIELKVKFVKRLFSEMDGVRENATHAAVVFLDGGVSEFENIRSIPDIVQQQDTDIKIFVVYFGVRFVDSIVYMRDAFLVRFYSAQLPTHVLSMAICDRCVKGWVPFRRSDHNHYLACYFLFKKRSTVSWQVAENTCNRQFESSLVAIETQKELSFLQARVTELLKEHGTPKDRSNVSSNAHVQVYIGLKRDRTSEAKRFHWSQDRPTQTRPLVVSNWLEGKPSGGMNVGCAVWRFEWRSPNNGTDNFPNSEGTPVNGWTDVRCKAGAGMHGLCEVVLPRRIEDTTTLTVRPATNESSGQALAKGDFKVLGNNIVSVSIRIMSTHFLKVLKQSAQDTFPLFECGVSIPDPRYISYLFVCDGVDHCSNRRDEMNCFQNSYATTEVADRNCTGVHCCHRICLPLQRVGDGEVDCNVCAGSARGSEINDENENISKSLNVNDKCALFCNDHDGCVHFSQLNDSHVDCTGPEGPLDETIGKLETVDTCRSVLGHRIWAPKCVYVTDNDGTVVGCRDMSHLQECTDFVCPEGYFKCPDTYCIPQHYVQDGKVDCPAGEEENNYTISPCTGNFACWNSKVCLHPDLVCDGHPDCQHQDDEVDCRVKCPEGLRCISGTVAVSDYSKSIPADSLNRFDSTTRFLNLSGVDLSASEFTFLEDLHHLTVIIFSGCNIKLAGKQLLSHTSTLHELDLSHNLLHILDGLESYNSPLVNVRYLNLSHNRDLKDVNNLNLKFLETLDLSHTSVYQLLTSFLEGLPSLKHIDLSFAKITNINKNTFPAQRILTTLDLRGLALKDFSVDFLNGLTVTQNLYTDSFELCCPQIRGENIPNDHCHSPVEAISSCFDLVGVDVQRVLLWVVTVLAVLGNMTVIVYRVIWDRSVLSTCYGLFVTNMGISDFIMGVYLFIIAAADFQYRGVYILFDENWRGSYVCSASGFLATLSCETSTFFVFLITLDRFLVMKFPFGEIKFNKVTKMVAVVMSWIIGFLLALTPIVFQFEIYSSNAMCLGLPLTTKQLNGWEFSFAVFIVLNFCLFFFIVYGQRAIFRAMSGNRKSQTASRRAQDITVAQQLSLVVLSNFLCWFPVGLLGLLSLGGHEISNDVYAWTTVIVLPINSAANPLLYTIPALMAKWERFKHRETRSVQMST